MINHWEETPFDPKRGLLSPTTIRYTYSVLRIALGRALKQGKSCGTLRRTWSTCRPRRRWSSDRWQRIRRAHCIAGTATDRLGPLYAVAIATGLRQGELLALRWPDVDLDAGTLTVRHTLRRRTHELGEPKTKSGQRTLELAGAAIDALRVQRTRQSAARVTPLFVFTSRNGTPLTHGTSRRTSRRHSSGWDSPASGSTTYATRTPR